MQYFLNVTEVSYGHFDYKIKLIVDDSNGSSPETVFKWEKIDICKIIFFRIKATESNMFKAVTDSAEIFEKVKIVNTSKFTATNNQKTYILKENPTNEETISWQFK